MNKEMLQKVVDVLIVVNGDGLDMRSWSIGDATGVVEMINLENIDDAKKEVSCGTTACIAGWTEAIWEAEGNPRITNRRFYEFKGWERPGDIEEDSSWWHAPVGEGKAAEVILGLNISERSQLFYADSDFWRNHGATQANKHDDWQLHSSDAINGLTALISNDVSLDDES